MRILILAVVVGLAAGCGSRPQKGSSVRKVDQARLARAKTAFAAFADEAAKGADMAESISEPDKLQEQVDKLRKMLDEASDIYPENARMAELGDDGKGTMRFFAASLATIRHHKGPVSETAKKGIQGACSQNADSIRKMAERIKGKTGPGAGEAGRAVDGER